MRERVSENAGQVERLERRVTQLERANRELTERAGQLRAFLDAEPECVKVLAADGRLLEMNPAGLRMLDADSFAQVAGQRVESMVVEEQRAAFRDLVTRSLAGEAGVLEFEIVSLRGTRRWLETHAAPMRNASGAVSAVLGITRDITDRKSAEAALKEREQQLRLYAEHSPAAIAMLDRDLRYLVASRRWMEDFRLGEASIIGRSHYEVFPEIPEHWKQVHRRCLAGAVERGEEPFARADGRIDWIRWEIHPWYRGDGEIGGIMIFSEDVSVRHRAEQERAMLEAQLLQAQKMESVGRLAGGVAHDFNNMLGVILGYAELAMSEVPADHPLVRHLQHIQEAAERSAGLTRQLLGFARRQTIQPRLLDLNETVGGMQRLLERLVGEDLDIVLETAADLWSVLLDPTQVDQILANLAVNARDAVEGTGRLTIGTANRKLDAEAAARLDLDPGDYVLLRVSDTGSGMDDNVRRHLFEPFFTTKEIGKGTGLGLATIYGIVKQNGGGIQVESAPGRGTTFTLYFPRAAPTAMEVSPERRALLVPGNETVLVVEDEVWLLGLVRSMLELCGYRVISAASPERALELIGEHDGEIDLLLTDMVMPVMSGVELAERVRALRPTIRVLCMSGHPTVKGAPDAEISNQLRLLVKPFSMAMLAAKVRESLDE
jgi:PAS domain S-box-containing protein